MIRIYNLAEFFQESDGCWQLYTLVVVIIVIAAAAAGFLVIIFAAVAGFLRAPNAGDTIITATADIDPTGFERLTI